MPDRTLKPLPITAERFAPFGDLIGARKTQHSTMNEARFERFDDLAKLDIAGSNGGRLAISIARSRTPTSLPYRVDMVERHPLGSQAFIPMTGFPFIVVVALPGESVEAADLHAFVTQGAQGINYHRGTWHMPLISLEEGQQYLIVDRTGGGNNCEQRVLDDAVVLETP